MASSLYQLAECGFAPPAQALAAGQPCLVLASRFAMPEGLPAPLASEQSAAAHFRDAAQAEGFLLRRRITRGIVARAFGRAPDEMTITPDSKGKPVLQGAGLALHLSFGAHGEVALIGIAHQPIGVDLEGEIAPEALPLNILRQDERAALLALPYAERGPAFLTLWTLKEAVVKALGCGFSVPPEAVHLPLSWLAAKVSPGGFHEIPVIGGDMILTAHPIQVLCYERPVMPLRGMAHGPQKTGLCIAALLLGRMA